jgi:tetratricopeptide (TPR) repeat protein
VATLLRNIALVCSMQGKYQEAESLNRRALSIAEETLGPGHPTVGWALRGLATIYRNQGRHREAEPLFRRALDIQEETLGPAHPSLGLTLFGLAASYVEQNRYDEAEPLFESAADILQESHGAGHHRVATAHNGLAHLYTEQARYQEAQALYDERLAVAQSEHSDIPISAEQAAALASTLIGIGELQERTGETAKARASWQAAVASIEESTGSAEIVERLDIHAKALLHLGRVEEARPMVEKLLAMGWQKQDLLALCHENGLASPSPELPAVAREDPAARRYQAMPAGSARDQDHRYRPRAGAVTGTTGESRIND